LWVKDEVGDILIEYYLLEKGYFLVFLNKVINVEIVEEMVYCYVRMKSDILECFKR